MPPAEPPEWSEDDWRESILRYQLRVKATTIKRLATKLEHAGDFPTDTPAKLSRLIRHSVEILSNNLETTPSDQLKNVILLLCLIAEHLRFVERSQTANTPWSMIQGTEQFLKCHTSSSTDFIIRPQWSNNYSLRGEFVEIYRTSLRGLEWIPIESWEASIEELAHEKIYCISFPRIERLNCLLHPNWGHEVGHIIAKKWIEANFDDLWQPEQAQIKSRIEQETLKNPPPVAPLFQDFLIQQIVAQGADTAMQAARDGLTELICDAVGVHLLGPSALAAAIEFSAPLSIDESPLVCNMYPPWRYRIRLMLELCEKDLDIIKNDDEKVVYPGPVIEPFWNWLKKATYLVQNTADRTSLQSAITTREAYRVIEANWPQVRQQAIQLLPDESEPYHLFKQVRIVEDLVRKLEHDTPPNEVGQWPDDSPASLEDILNAAWVFKTTRACPDSGWGTPDDFEKLFRLVLKAIEAGFVHRTYGAKLKTLEQQ